MTRSPPATTLAPLRRRSPRVQVFCCALFVASCRAPTTLCVETRAPSTERPLDGTDTLVIEVRQGDLTLARQSFPMPTDRQIALDPLQVRGLVVARIEGSTVGRVVARAQTLAFDPALLGGACTPAYLSLVGRFAPTPTMPPSEALGPAVLPLDPETGRVLIPFLRPTGEAVMAIYRHADGHYETGAALARASPGAAWLVLDDGSVVVVGGEFPGTFRYDPANAAAGFVEASVQPTTPLVGHAAVALPGRCWLVSGGAADAVSLPTDLVWRGCVLADGTVEWTSANLPVALRDQAAVALAGGRVALVGGNSGSAIAPAAVDRAWIVDATPLSAGAILDLRPLNDPRFGAAVAAADAGGLEYVLAAGGTGVGGALATIEYLSLDRPTFARSAVSLAAGVTGALALRVDRSRVLVAGGTDGAGLGHRETLLYDPNLGGRSIPIDPLPAALGRPSGAPIGDGTAFVAGVDDTGIARVLVFNPP